MSWQWEWDYSSKDRQWTLTIGEWLAVVQRVEGPRYLWRAFIERTTEPHERHEGPTMQAAVDGRTWCLTMIATLRTKGAGFFLESPGSRLHHPLAPP